MGSEGTPGHPAGSGVPVQPDVGGPVPAGWLDEYELTESGQRVDRLVADQDLITTLALQRYEGPDYDVFQTELAKYGIDVMVGWIVRGVIFARCRERGSGGLPPPPDGWNRDRETVEELAFETVAKALWHFRRDVLLKNRWVSSGGATLKTFFVGQCLFRFANVYRAWHKSELRRSPVVDAHDALAMTDQAEDGPEDVAVARREIVRGLRIVKDERVRAALVLTAEGLPQWQIANRLGVTEKTVERMLANHRARMRKMV